MQHHDDLDMQQATPYYNLPNYFQAETALPDFGMPAPQHQNVQQPGIKMVPVDIQQFVRTRDALSSAYVGLSSAIDRAVKAYIDHTNVVLAGDATLDVTFLTKPFDQIAHTAQLAQQALYHNQDLGQVQPNVAQSSLAAPATPATKEENGDEKGKRKKRQYKARDPNAPKRPQTAYFRYLQDQRPILGKQLADAAQGQPQKPGDLSKHATAQWNALTDAQKVPYKQAYQRELKEYERKAAKYRAEGGVLTEKDIRILAAMDKEGVEAAAEQDQDEDEDEEEDDVDATVAKVETQQQLQGAAEDDDDDDDDDDDSDDDDDEDEKEPTPPPPAPAAKTPKSAMKKAKQAAAPTPQFSSLNPSLPAATPATASKPSSSPERKRKAAATPSSDAAAAGAGAEEPPKKKRGRKSNAEKAAMEAAQATPAAPAAAPPAPVAQMSTDTPSADPAKKKKKRKSVVAGAD